MNLISLFSSLIIAFIAVPALYALPMYRTPEDFPECPAGTLKTDVTISSQQQRIIFCYKVVGTDRLNHGDYWRFDLAGNLIETLYYQDAKQVQKSAPIQAVFENNQDENKPVDFSYMRSIAHEMLMRFLPIQRQDRGHFAVGGFETRECLTDQSGLLQYYRRKRSSFYFDYKFHRGRCSLQGRHDFMLEKIHRANFEVNDLSRYQKIQFLLHIKPTIIDDENTKIELKMTQAQLVNDLGGLHFEAQYQVTVDSSGRAVGDHQGKLILHRHLGEKIQQEFALKAPIKPAP